MKMNITRRSALTLLAGAACAQPKPAGIFDELPNFCSHEHWGSIRSIGSVPEGFRADVECGATPTRATGLLDLIVDPYSRGWYTSGGANLDAVIASAETEPWNAFQKLRPVLRQHQTVGVYQCLRRGIQRLHNADLNLLSTEPAFAKLNGAIASKYVSPFSWYREAMKQARFSELIRIVHPEFYVRGWDSASGADERSFTRTIMRIDPFLDLWRSESPRRSGLAAIAGVEPADAVSWRAFLQRIFELAAQKGALGIKQLQAYRRPLDFQPRGDADVTWRGDLTPAQVTVFQDWVVHECCKLAADRGWVHQVHVGTNNIGQSFPLPLQDLARRYGRMKLVMIHCWPFLEQAGWLAKHVPNIYIDTCWQPILNPRFFEQAITMWWNYVPAHKITCGHDATSVEMAVGSSLFTREILSRVLTAGTALGLSRTDLLRIGAGYLHNNAVEIYKVGAQWRADGRPDAPLVR